MHIKTIASATVLAAMLGLGSAAYAQTMIGNQTIEEADMERVTVFCEDLKTASEQAVDTAKPEGEATPESTTESGSLDLEEITLEQCIEAGIVEATP